MVVRARRKQTDRNECVASKPGYTAISLALDSVQRLGENPAREIDVNGRHALEDKQTNIEGVCGIAIEITKSARAVIGISMQDVSNNAKSCSDLENYAKSLEPKLPKA